AAPDDVAGGDAPLASALLLARGEERREILVVGVRHRSEAIARPIGRREAASRYRRRPRPVTSGRSSAARRPGVAGQTARIAFTSRVAVRSPPPTAWSPRSSQNSYSQRMPGSPLTSTR